MLHCIINGQGNCLDEWDDISEKILFFTCFLYISGLLCRALILGIIVMANNKPM